LKQPNHAHLLLLVLLFPASTNLQDCDTLIVIPTTGRLGALVSRL
jgi:hypothetical protein